MVDEQLWCPECRTWTGRDEQGCTRCSTKRDVEVARSAARARREGEQSLKRAAQIIFESAMAEMRRHIQAIEGVLRQLVERGYDVSSMSVNSYGPLGHREEVWCQNTCVCAVKRTWEGLEITVKYVVYPNGRPEGWPELKLEVPSEVSGSD